MSLVFLLAASSQVLLADHNMPKIRRLTWRRRTRVDDEKGLQSVDDLLMASYQEGPEPAVETPVDWRRFEFLELVRREILEEMERNERGAGLLEAENVETSFV